MFHPARLKSAMVASCRLPLGMPRRSLLATGGLLLREFNGPRETAHRALMANQAIAFYFHAKQERVVVAIGGYGDDAQAVAAGFALHPQLLAGAAPEGDEAGFQGFLIAGLIQKTQHQHFSGARVLH